MTDTPSLPPGGEKQPDQVEAVARALYEHWKHNAMPIGRWIDQDRRFRQHFEDAARAALSASKPLVVEECARVAGWHYQNAVGAREAKVALDILDAIRALKESPSKGSGG